MPENLTVLHLSSEKSWRGGEQQIAYLIEELQKNGVKNLVALKKGSAFEEYCKLHKIPFIALGFKNEFDVNTALRVKKFAKKNKVDLLHLHTAKAHGIGVLSHLLGLKIPLVLSKRTDFPIKKNVYARFKFNYHGIKKILCVSSKIKSIIDPDLKDSLRAEVVYSGVDLGKFHFEQKYFFHDLLGLSHDIKLVGNTSAIAPHKDYFTFVNVAEKVCGKDEDVRFLIIGKGPMEDEIKSFVKEKGLEDKVLFTGFIKNLPEVLFNLDVFLITSNEEGLGTSILDAHACGVPVVATRAGGIPEIVIEGVTGSLAAVGDVKALSEKVLFRLADKNVYEAREFVKSFSKVETARKTLEVYKSLW